MKNLKCAAVIHLIFLSVFSSCPAPDFYFSPGGDSKDESDSQAFQCSAEDASWPQPSRIRRLPTKIFLNYFLRFLETKLTTSEVNVVWSNLSAERSQFASDQTKEHIARTNAAFDFYHTNAIYQFTKKFAAQLTNAAYLSRVAGSCAISVESASESDCLANPAHKSCIEEFQQQLSRRFWNRNLTTAERTDYHSFACKAERGVRLTRLIERFSNSPELVFMDLSGNPATVIPGSPSAGAYELSDYEIAERIAHIYLSGPAPETLLSAADQGRLRDVSSRSQVISDLLLNDPKFHETMKEFVEGYFRLNHISTLSNSLLVAPGFQEYAAGVAITPALDQAIYAEVMELFVHHLKKGQSFSDFLQSDSVLTAHSELSKIYGVSSGVEERRLDVHRRGILSRVAFMTVPRTQQSPILRGKFIREEILCDSIAPPPANLDPEELKIPPFDGQHTTRDIIDLKTSPSRCIGCHVQMNPLGFVFSGFDTLGRYSSHEGVFDPATKQFLAFLPVNEDAKIYLSSFSDESVATGPADFHRQLAQNGKPYACFARKYFRFSQFKDENVTKDGCQLELLRRDSRSKSLRDVVFGSTLTNQFGIRVIP